MGKGDRRTRRGKIWRSTHGKTRPRSEERAEARKRHGLKRSQVKQQKRES